MCWRPRSVRTPGLPWHSWMLWRVTIRTLISSNLLWCTRALGWTLWAQTCVPAPAGLAASVTFDEPRYRALANRVSGQVGQAIRFDGKASFLEVPASAAMDAGEGDFSVEIWLRTTVKDRIRNLADHRNEAPRGWLLYIRRDQPGFQVADAAMVADAVPAGAPAIADGRWHHVVGVAKRLPPQPPAIYVDGRGPFKGQRNVPLANLSHQTPLWFGRHHRNSYVAREDYFFTGDLDEFAFYRRALTPADVAALYRAGRAGQCKK